MSDSGIHGACAERLMSALGQVEALTAFVGFDGFIDEIIHVVDKRESGESFSRLNTIQELAERLGGAAGKSTNIELVPQITKLGGNGPIMANALARFGIRVTYLGNLGYPSLHPVFKEFSQKAEVYSIAEPCQTDALEFLDGKIMLGKSTPLNEITWEHIQDRFGRERFAAKFNTSSLVGFVNWTMTPYMSEIWQALLTELCPILSGPRRALFFDLADPEKRSSDDIQRALELIVAFQKHFDVVLGLNEKEACELAEVCGIAGDSSSKERLASLAAELHRRLPVSNLVVHPVTYALAVADGQCDIVDGPYVPRPLITTGAGDHFNAGFCLGKLLGLDNRNCVLTGVATSGYYVRTARSPGVLDLVGMMKQWP